MSKTVTKKNPFNTSNDEVEIIGVDSSVDTNTQFTFEGNSLPQNLEDLIKKGLKNSGIPEEAIKAGLKIGEQIIKDSQSKFIDYFSLDGLKPYFNVTNKYVLLKLIYIILPFLYKVDSNLSTQQNLKNWISWFIYSFNVFYYLCFINWI